MPLVDFYRTREAVFVRVGSIEECDHLLTGFAFLLDHLVHAYIIPHHSLDANLKQRILATLSACGYRV